MIKVGIVGCGLIGDVHLKLLKSMKNIRIVGIADRDTERAKSFALRAKKAIFVRNLETLLEPGKPDVVHILTPPFTHAPLVCTAVQLGVTSV